jgi:aminopeptidase N
VNLHECSSPDGVARRRAEQSSPVDTRSVRPALVLPLTTLALGPEPVKVVGRASDNLKRPIGREIPVPSESAASKASTLGDNRRSVLRMARASTVRWSALTLIAALPLVISMSPATAGTSKHGEGATPGSVGLGDRLYPTLGNGGYDALHYDLALRYATAAPSQGIDGTVTMRARATQSLSRFDLDFSGIGVGSVSVNGRAASFTRSGEELVITPSRPIRKHSRFTVKVRHFRADPTVPDPDVFLSTAFFITPNGSATSGQPNAMHSLYPSNDHPRDKASFSFRFDVPTGTTAVANGVLVAKRRHGGRTAWTYVQRQPMATELTQLAVGKFSVVKRGRVGGVRVRDVVPTRLVPQYDAILPVEKDHLRWMRQRVGSYPFDLYGSLIVDTTLGFALETQTLSLYDTPWFNSYPRGLWDPVMLHELAHQWVGDSVAPYEWSDVWQNEGHASWYEFTYAEEHGFLSDDTGTDYTTVEALMKRVYELGDVYRDAFGPVAQPLSGDVNDVFSSNAYYGGALVLYALRQQVGVETFGRIERAWVKRDEGRSASTRDFIRLASHVSGQDLHGFLTKWLYGTTTPPMPGHPDWTVAPVECSALSARLASTALPDPRRR